MSLIFHHISSIGHHFFVFFLAEKHWGWKYPTDEQSYKTNRVLHWCLFPLVLCSLVCWNSLPTAQQTSLNGAAQWKNWYGSLSKTPLICAWWGAQEEKDLPQTLTYIGKEPSLQYLKAPPHYYSSLRGCTACVFFLWLLKLGFSSPHSGALPVQLPWFACMHELRSSVYLQTVGPQFVSIDRTENPCEQ